MGVDLVTEAPVPAGALTDGTVLSVGESEHVGKYVVLDHEEETQSRYYRLSCVSVHPGQLVKEGEPVGVSLRPLSPDDEEHIHWEIWVDNKSVDPIEYMSTYADEDNAPNEEQTEHTWEEIDDSLPCEPAAPIHPLALVQTNSRDSSPDNEGHDKIFPEITTTPEGDDIVAYIALQRAEDEHLHLWSHNDLMEINSAYGFRIIRLELSPSEEYASVTIHDNDVLAVTSTYDIERGTWMRLIPDSFDYGSCCSRWHPSKDILFYRADPGIGANAVIYQVRMADLIQSRLPIDSDIAGYEAREEGLSVRKVSCSLESQKDCQEEMVMIPYTDFVPVGKDEMRTK